MSEHDRNHNGLIGADRVRGPEKWRIVRDKSRAQRKVVVSNGILRSADIRTSVGTIDHGNMATSAVLSKAHIKYPRPPSVNTTDERTVLGTHPTTVHSRKVDHDPSADPTILQRVSAERSSITTRSFALPMNYEGRETIARKEITLKTCSAGAGPGSIGAVSPGITTESRRSASHGTGALHASLQDCPSTNLPEPRHTTKDGQDPLWQRSGLTGRELLAEHFFYCDKDVMIEFSNLVDFEPRPTGNAVLNFTYSDRGEALLIFTYISEQRLDVFMSYLYLIDYVKSSGLALRLGPALEDTQVGLITQYAMFTATSPWTLLDLLKPSGRSLQSND